MIGCKTFLHFGKQLRQVFLKDLWTREIAGGPIIDEGQETVQLSDDPRNVFSVGNQETMEGILIIVRMRQTGQEILGLWCTGQLFGQTASYVL